MYQNTINKLTEKNVLLESENDILRRKITEKNKYIRTLLTKIKKLEIDNVCKKTEIQITIYDYL